MAHSSSSHYSSSDQINDLEEFITDLEIWIWILLSAWQMGTVDFTSFNISDPILRKCKSPGEVGEQ